eukprot:COSAG02_NODE_3621_length_6458_cov_23.823243_2_plen_459_part_00
MRDGGNYDPASLAQHYIDGTAWALERFLYYGTELVAAPASSAARVCAVPTVHADDLTYDEFFRCYLIPNNPVVIQGVTSEWSAARDWVTGSGSPDVVAMAKLLPGHARAPVVGIWADDPTRVTSKQISVRDYAKWWAERHGETAPIFDDINGYGTQNLDGEKLYLKDWHFASEHGAVYSAYSCPVWFRDDWLHPFASEETAKVEDGQAGATEREGGRDHRFVYLGPAGSTTRMHCDVMASYSWSVNVCGLKRWQLVPPHATPLLFDGLGDQMAADLTDCCSCYGGLETARGHAIEIIQQSGEAIFVPSGWHHSVENLEDTLSINHNWINACNLQWTVDHVLSRLQKCANDRNADSPADINTNGKEGAAEQEARMLAAVIDEAAARACRLYQEEASTQTTRCLKAVYDVRVAQVALDRLYSAGIYTMCNATRDAMKEAAAAMLATAAAASTAARSNVKG